MTGSKRTGNSGRRGGAIIEFALVTLLFCLLLLAFVEFGRMLLVYNSVANAARAGVRYAIVNGNGGGSRPGSGPAADPLDVVTVVENFAASAPLDKDDLIVSVTYPWASNAIGAPVHVQVVYPYNPLVVYFPLNVNLGSVSEGRIAF